MKTSPPLRTLVSALALLLLADLALAGPPRPATPEEIKERIAAAGSSKDHGGAPWVTVLDEADVRVKSSGLAFTESCRVVKILTPAGIKAHAVLKERFDPDTYRVAWRSVRVHRKDGTLIDVALSNLTSQPSRQGSIMWGGTQQSLVLPRLAVGDAIEVRMARVGFNIAYLEGEAGGAGAGLDATGLEPPMPGHWHETVRFSGSKPTIHKRFSVHTPRDMPLQYEVCNGTLSTSLRFDDDRHVLTFIGEDIPAFKGEPNMASRDDCVTKVVLATLDSWEEKSRWFHRVNETQFEANNAIRAKVAEITAGLDEEEALQACLHWVADNIRYIGTSRGPCEGFTLHTGIETFRDRAGVCKDIAGMLITMLRVLGHDAYPALTMAGPKVEDVPADQFNHTVTAVRLKDGTFRVLDPTWSPTSKELWSSREALQGLVYGTEEGETLTLSPYFPPEHNRVRIVSKGGIDADGTLTTKLRFDLAGYGGTNLRRSMGRVPLEERRNSFVSVLSIAPNIELLKWAIIDPTDYSTDAWAEVEVRAKGYAAGGAGVRVFTLPLLSHPLGRWLVSDVSSVSGPNERRFPLRLRATRLIEYEERLELPPGWKVAKLPGKVEIKSAAADLTFTAKAAGGAIEYSLRLAAKHHLIPPEDYPAFRKTIEAMVKLAAERIVVTVEEGGKDAR